MYESSTKQIMRYLYLEGKSRFKDIRDHLDKKKGTVGNLLKRAKNEGFIKQEHPYGQYELTEKGRKQVEVWFQDEEEIKQIIKESKEGTSGSISYENYLREKLLVRGRLEPDVHSNQIDKYFRETLAPARGGHWFEIRWGGGDFIKSPMSPPPYFRGYFDGGEFWLLNYIEWPPDAEWNQSHRDFFMSASQEMKIPIYEKLKIIRTIYNKEGRGSILNYLCNDTNNLLEEMNAIIRKLSSKILIDEISHSNEKSILKHKTPLGGISSPFLLQKYI
ncbi:hypothetical protein AKJ43_02250 [candidate division MSBL1 archaeon SCGC-AAA261D19]|uniref:Uncharacterized protein n=1 Tax=candidate division MSBL1 archaeon SCGC-AAA261D19 TaxID=1698273 RepID=A0A133V6W3_9EURY|nr:hypothetical protein AKJ43_02250 [candidate division MSBL1 archaeon SCGC-AAA261D19]